jgi:hypothetical protein
MDDWDHLDELDDPSTWFFGGHRKRIARKGCGVSMKGWRMVNDWNILRFTEFTVSCSVAMFVHMSLKPAMRKAVGAAKHRISSLDRHFSV